MNEKIQKEILSDPQAIEEINKHRWYESEKQGHDVGFKHASEDWLKKYSKAWMRQNTSYSGFLGWFSQLFAKKNS
jgi:hypothetical protein